MNYVLTYIDMNGPYETEVLGVFSDKDTAVDQLLERANYRERDGSLTQYMRPTSEYPSFSHLRALVMRNMELIDCDVYRITEVPRPGGNDNDSNGGNSPGRGGGELRKRKRRRTSDEE